ncbi:DUF4406 domain-containing protein [Frischella perrara]|uniref:DUF4406 domain-containing protein n=1 Tax=Frischella perrara TaxID=1267021 RepID=UPI0023F467D8|nr:DUF4406 domain-containing protein [Frischella perrara]MCT6875589.1 DUF4406 domain-containing protein [Frischella perrara]
MTIVYIAGPISGHENRNKNKFLRAEQELKKRGFVVLNPHCLPAGLSEAQYMDICLAMVRSSDAIYLLDGWENSLGAVAEHALAKKNGLSIITGDMPPLPPLVGTFNGG